MKETFFARWVRRFKSAGRRAKQFFSLHPLQSGLLLFMILLISAQVWLVVDQNRENASSRARIQALPTIQLNELNQRIKDNQVQKIVRHTLSTGNVLKPQTKNYLEVIGPKGAVVLEESSEVPVILPDGFALDDRREYGAAAVHFLTLS